MVVGSHGKSQDIVSSRDSIFTVSVLLSEDEDSSRDITSEEKHSLIQQLVDVDIRQFCHSLAFICFGHILLSTFFRNSTDC